MITANAVPYANFMHLEIIFPDKKQHELKTVANLQEANRLIYFLNRKYILSKLTSWLKQRRFALQSSPDNGRTLEAAKLIVLLHYYENAGLHVLCQFIINHKTIIETVAPGNHSSQYNHYKNIIQPILVFCHKMSE